MITLSRTFVRAKEALPSVDDLRQVGETAYQATEAAAGEVLSLSGLGSRVEVSEGSTEVIAEILGGAGMVITAICNYDGFWSGLDRMRAQARKAGEFVRRRLKRDSRLERSCIVSSRVTTGQLTSLERLHRRVRERQLSADEAVQKALRILRDAGDTPDTGLIRSLESAFQAPRQGLSRLERMDEYTREVRDAYTALPEERRGSHVSVARKRKWRVVIERLPDTRKKTVSYDD